ncbi:MAG: hypothetical protein Q4A75_08510 [Peptostreptococcaceae bacterium]|nr:hypothetical protein [Peptostreptococcaceae bacterium]
MKKMKWIPWIENFYLTVNLLIYGILSIHARYHYQLRETPFWENLEKFARIPGMKEYIELIFALFPFFMIFLAVLLHLKIERMSEGRYGSIRAFFKDAIDGKNPYFKGDRLGVFLIAANCWMMKDWIYVLVIMIPLLIRGV